VEDCLQPRVAGAKQCSMDSPVEKNNIKPNAAATDLTALHLQI